MTEVKQNVFWKMENCQKGGVGTFHYGIWAVFYNMGQDLELKFVLDWMLWRSTQEKGEVSLIEDLPNLKFGETIDCHNGHTGQQRDLPSTFSFR